MKKPVIIDTPMNIGAFLALAYADRQFDVRSISVSSYGDVSEVCSAAEILNIQAPVYTGAVKPIIREATFPWCGPKGDHSFSKLFISTGCGRLPECGYAWDAVMAEAKKQGGSLEIIILGSLTNLAIALLKYPDLTKQIAKITIMGGSRFCGNCPDSPQCEFNFHYDPEAAHIVLNSGIPLVIADLNTCMSVEWNCENIKKLCSAVPEAKLPLPGFLCKYGISYSLNELVAAALAESFTEAQTMNLAANVETDSLPARGKLVLEYDTAAMGLESHATLFSSLDEEALKKRIFGVFDIIQ